jgi:phosphatidylinositol alpha-mannosyltransferase
VRIGLSCPYNILTPGGVKQHVLALYRKFKEWGHEVFVITPGVTGGPKSSDFVYLGRGIKILGNKSVGTLNFCLGVVNDPVEEFLKMAKLDILHIHEPMIPFLNWQLLEGSRAVNIATFHSNYPESQSINSWRFILKPIEPHYIKKIDGGIAVSEVAKKCWWEFMVGKGVIIPNGVDMERFNPKVEPLDKYKDGKVNILYVGRLEPRKGILELLRAFNGMIRNVEEVRRKVRLLIVGSGPSNYRAKLFVRQHGLSRNVVFEGGVSDRVLPKYYAMADIFCSPAVGGESFGIVLLEAMASGKPIVCFANEGYKEVMKNYPWKEALVEVRDVFGLANSLLSLIENKRLREKLGRWGVGKVRRYSWDKVAGRVLEFYEKVKRKKGKEKS